MAVLACAVAALIPSSASAGYGSCTVTVGVGAVTNIEAQTAADQSSTKRVCLQTGYYGASTSATDNGDSVIRVGRNVEVTPVDSTATPVVGAEFDFRGSPIGRLDTNHVGSNDYPLVDHANVIVYGNDDSPYNKSWAERKVSGTSDTISLTNAQCANLSGAASCDAGRFTNGGGRDILDTAIQGSTYNTHWHVNNQDGSYDATNGWYSPEGTNFYLNPDNNTRTNDPAGYETFAWPTNGLFDSGADKNIIVWDHTTNASNPRMFEFWHTANGEPSFNGDTIESSTGVAYDTNPDNDSGGASGQLPDNKGSIRESGILVAPTVYRGVEVQKGINHPLNVSVYQKGTGFVHPASHDSNGNTSGALPYGTLLRLRADFDVSSFPSGTQKVLIAMKRYGILIDDDEGGQAAEIEKSDASTTGGAVDQPYYSTFGDFGNAASSVKFSDLRVVCTPGLSNVLTACQ